MTVLLPAYQEEPKKVNDPLGGMLTIQLMKFAEIACTGIKKLKINSKLKKTQPKQ